MLYNVVLASNAQQNESAIHIHISPPFWISLHLGHHRILGLASLEFAGLASRLEIQAGAVAEDLRQNFFFLKETSVFALQAFQLGRKVPPTFSRKISLFKAN